MESGGDLRRIFMIESYVAQRAPLHDLLTYDSRTGRPVPSAFLPLGSTRFSPFSKKISKQAREVLLEYGLPPLGTKESPNPAYIIFLSVSRSPKASACWSTRYSLSARVISLSNSARLLCVVPGLVM